MISRHVYENINLKCHDCMLLPSASVCFHLELATEM